MASWHDQIYRHLGSIAQQIGSNANRPLDLPGSNPGLPGGLPGGQPGGFPGTGERAATWDTASGNARMGSPCTMRLSAPGLAAGVPVVFRVTQVGLGEIGQVEVTSVANGAVAEWDDWYDFDRVTNRVQLEPGQPFPPVQFTFTAKAGDVEATAATPLVYSDTLNARLVDPDTQQGLGETAYVLHSPWGTRAGKSGPDGSLVEKDLPPGGATIVVGSVGMRN